jgi:hypothetical protein
MLSFSPLSCLTFYSINNYKSENEILFEEYTESKIGHIIIKNYINTPASIMNCTPFIDIHDKNIFVLSIETKNYDSIENIEITELKIIINNLEIDVFKDIEIEGNNIEKYIDIGEEEYLIFKETNKIKLFPNDKIYIVNHLSINYSKVKKIEVKIAMKLQYKQNTVTKEFITLFKKKPNRGLGFWFGN